MESSPERVLLWGFQVNADSGGPMEAWAGSQPPACHTDAAASRWWAINPARQAQ